MTTAEAAKVRAGYLYGVVAYVLWGLVPIYFRTVRESPAGEILAHRIIWSLFLTFGLVWYFGLSQTLVAVLRNKKTMLILLLSALLLALNWLFYILGTVLERVSEASLGYFMMPLTNALLGAIFLGERLRPAHYPALLLVAIGVSFPIASGNQFPWIALSVPFSFAFYSLVRKVSKVDSFTSLAVETMMLTPLAVAYAIWSVNYGGGKFGESLGWSTSLVFAGVVTVVPLIFFGLSLTRLSLLAVSFIQFLSPTMQLFVAMFWLNETIGWERWVAMICVWIAAAIFVTDAVWANRKTKGTPPSEVPLTDRGQESPTTS